MQERHAKLYDENKIKIYNSSILDFNKKINEHCFVIGMEILDNMPHDRLYKKNKSDETFSEQAVIEIKTDHKTGEEKL